MQGASATPWHGAAEAALQRFVDDGTLPAAALATGTSQRFDVTTFGVVAPHERVTRTTLFDLASLTKVVATLPIVLRLADDGVVDLDAPLRTYLPNAGWMHEPSLADRTMRDLLRHTSGLPAALPFIAVASNRRQVIGNALAAQLTSPAGTVTYSDLGFILLGVVAEWVTDMRLDALFAQRVSNALAMRHARFVPLTGNGDGSRLEDVAPTEACAWRGHTLRGEVHDEAAWLMGGVAGHAGLFATVDDVARYAQAWLRLDPALASPGSLDAAVRRATLPGEPARGLGWLLAHDGEEGERLEGDWRGPRGFGHTGFTGTSVWIDPTSDRFCVVLSNRVHPNRHRVSMMASVRRSLHDVVFADGG